VQSKSNNTKEKGTEVVVREKKKKQKGKKRDVNHLFLIRSQVAYKGIEDAVSEDETSDQRTGRE